MNHTIVRCGKACAQAYYSLCRVFRTSRPKVCFLSRQSERVSYTFSRLIAAFEVACPQAKIVTLVKMLSNSFAGRVAYVFHMLRQIFHIATANIVIVEGYVPAVSIITIKPDTTVAQVWHAPGAVKKFGYQVLDKSNAYSSDVANDMRMHKGYSVIYAAGKGCIAPYAEAFGYPEDAFTVFGTPECDYCREKDPVTEAALREQFPALFSGKKLILWAPTFKTVMNGDRAVMAEFIENLPDDCQLVCTRHPLAGMGDKMSVGGADTKEDYLSQMTDVIVPTGFDTRLLLGFVDAVVTDYSSLVFYAGIRRVPTYFLVVDYDEYCAFPGVNVDPLKKLPQVSFTSAKEAAQVIATDCVSQERARSFFNYSDAYLEGCEPGATERIVQDLLTRSGILV